MVHAAVPAALSNHRFPRRHFDDLCAGLGSAEAVTELWQTQRSRRLLLINAVFEAAAGGNVLGPLPPVSTVWEALQRAEAAAPEAVADILLHPQVGSWAAYTLRRYRKGVAGQASTPLWVDFGTLHAIALLAAARSGLTWPTRLPARDGRVMLPGLGMATLPGPPRHTYVEAEAGPGEIRLRGADPAAAGFQITVSPRTDAATEVAGWWALRSLQVGEDPQLRVWLDDLDPFRDLADPIEPQRLSEPDVVRWYKLLDEAWALLCANDRALAEAMAVGVTSLVPLPATEGWITRSASTGEAFGSVLVSPPFDAVTLAVALVHEFQHIKLGGLIHLGPLPDHDSGNLFHAPWRDDPRPLSGLLQGIYAFAGIAALWRDLRASVHDADRVGRRTADFEYAYTRRQVEAALRTAVESGDLTPWERNLMDRLAVRVWQWLAEAVPDESVRTAALLADSHRAGWRIRHTRAASADVHLIADAWIRGRNPASSVHPAHVEPDAEREQWSSRMAILARRAVANPDVLSLRSVTTEPAVDADIALLRGDRVLARSRYLERLAANHDDLDAWVGLGFADDSCRALIERPDLVRAVFLRLVECGLDPDPAALAAWIGGAASL